MSIIYVLKREKSIIRSMMSRTNKICSRKFDPLNCSSPITSRAPFVQEKNMASDHSVTKDAYR